MLHEKERHFQPHLVTLDALVPNDNFYRQAEAKLDLSFVRELVRDHYSLRMGRPSIDPVTFFKLHLIMFFEGIRSERQLMETVNLNLAHRWYIGYDLGEPVPDHSSLSKIRTRYGFEVFHRFFEKIVELCIEAGLVWGKELYFDGTKVRANAAMDIYNGQRLTSRPSHWYKRTADSIVSTTDTDATPMKHSDDDRAALGYHTHYVVDGGKARIILAALVTPASIMDNTPMLDLERWVCFRWFLFPQIAVGDTRYGTVANIAGLEQDGICAYVPRSDYNRHTPFYLPELFQYDRERDRYICPQGQQLPLKSRRKSEEVYIYIADTNTCNACPVKTECTDSKSGRYIFRSFFQDALDRAASYRKTDAYKKALRKRQVWIEPLFGEGKQWHGMRQFRLRGLEKVNIEGLMRAAGQNIKRLLKARTGKRPLKPAGSAALRPTFEWAFSLL